MAHADWTWWCVPYAELMIRLIPQLRALAPSEAAIHDMAVAHCETAWRDSADYHAHVMLHLATHLANPAPWHAEARQLLLQLREARLLLAQAQFLQEQDGVHA
eukprot:7451650-Pyramimonas_sp.AAC.1